MINEDSGDTYEEYLEWTKAAEIATTSPHEELRRSYKPGQRWQTRIPSFTDWFELPGEPGWFSYAEYEQILNKPQEALTEIKPKFPPKVQQIWDDCGTFVTSLEHEQGAKEIEFFVEKLLQEYTRDLGYYLKHKGYTNV